LDNPVLRTEGRVTMIDGILATAVLVSLTLNTAFGWCWADPAAGYVLVFYAAREVRESFSAHHRVVVPVGQAREGVHEVPGAGPGVDRG
jgi:divalent metal cation (Fe/Co/Zn/Cd) transporter